MEQSTTIYGADIVILEGSVLDYCWCLTTFSNVRIMALYDPVVRSMLDVKIFVDTDADICLCRRIRRDITERGRDVSSVLMQYELYVNLFGASTCDVCDCVRSDL
jgi:uridine kinase